jgi:Ca2+-binding RTX toxin-like protein
MFSRRLEGVVMLFIGLLTACALTGSASAATATTQTFGCRASVERTTALSVLTVEPFIANSSDTICASDTAGVTTPTVLNLGSLAAPLGGALSIGPAEAVTSSANTDSERSASSLVSVDAASLPTPAGAISIAAPVQATVSYDCVNGSVQATAGSTLSAISIAGNEVQLPSVGAPDTLPLDNSLGLQVGTISLNQNVVTATSDTETLVAVHLPGVADEVIGEATVDQPAVGACTGLAGSSTSPTGPSTVGGSAKPGSPTTTAPGAACPVGTSLVPSDGMCAIMNAAGKPSILVSPVNSGDIIGGRVMSLAQARAKYRTANCLRGSGPAFVVVGTRGKNHITVQKLRDRVLGLGGKDTVTVKGGKGTCVDGGGGNDRLVNKGKNMVSLYGAAGKDTIVLGNGSAFVKGGAGADHISAGNGRLTVYGGVGNDVIKVGSGHDTIIGGAGNNRLTARGAFAHVSAGKGKSIAWVRKANRAYAHKHGVKKVNVMG